MKTKKFIMTSLLVMGMIIAKAANGYPPELVLVSQPVLTYNANSVTIYYDVQNIGDYTYRGNLYIYLDPDNGYCYGTEYMRVCPGCIRRISVSIPAYRPNPSWVYTVMPYYELYGELYSFTTFEYFEPVRFCWYGPRNEPWVVYRVPPRPRHYYRPNTYRFYYDGYYPIMPPPPGGYPPGYFDGRPPMDPHHHTYKHHHDHGGYPANFTPDHVVPGYNKPSEATVVRPNNGSNTAGSMSSRTPAPNSNSNTNTSGTNGATTRPSNDNSGNSGSTLRPVNSNTSSSGTRPSSSSSSSSSSTVRPADNGSSNSGSSSSSRPSSSSSSNSSSTRSSTSSGSSNRTGTSTSSSNSSSSSNRSGSSSSGSSSSSRSGSSSSSSSSSRSGSTGGRR